jgi:hypothetical protein
MKVFAVMLAVGAAGAAGFLAPRPAAQDERALLEEIRWLAAAEYHRHNLPADKGSCDFTSCVRRHMEERAKAIAEWNSPEAQKRRAEEEAKLKEERRAFDERLRATKDKNHAELFKHPREERCDFRDGCREREVQWITQKLFEEKEKK